MTQTTTSKQFWLNVRDFGKALAVAALSTPVSTVLASVSAGKFTIDWTSMWHLALASGAAYLLKNFFTPSQTVIKSVLFIVGLGLSSATMSQSFFKAVPKVKAISAPTAYRGTLSVQPHSVISPDQPLPIPSKDSTVNAFRPVANLVAYAEPGNILMAGVGLSFQHLIWNAATQKWTCSWSISGMGWAGGTMAPHTPTDAVSYGLMFGVLNNLIMVGPALNHGKAQAVVSIGISFNN